MTSSSASRRVAFVVACALALVAPIARADAPTPADLETARALVKEGRTLRASGDVRGALEKFKAGHAVGQTPITALELARTHEMLGELVEAREVCLSVARMPVEVDETERSVAARADAARLATALQPRVASVVVRVSGVPAGALAQPDVRIDDQLIPAAALGEPRKVNPRGHTIVASLEGYETSRVDVVLAEGETKVIDIRLHAVPYVVIAEAPPSPTRRRLITTGIVAASVGTVVGAAAGLVAIHERGLLDDRCRNYKCPPSAYGALEDGPTWGTVSTVAFVVAGAGAALTILSLVLLPAPKSPRSAYVAPWLGAGAAGVRGAF
jgi:hypothetical protein